MLFSVGALGHLSGYDGGVQAVSERTCWVIAQYEVPRKLDKLDIVTGSPDRRRGIVTQGIVQQSQCLRKGNPEGVIGNSQSIRCV